MITMEDAIKKARYFLVELVGITSTLLLKEAKLKGKKWIITFKTNVHYYLVEVDAEKGNVIDYEERIGIPI